jgi:hypothetical protein
MILYLCPCHILEVLFYYLDLAYGTLHMCTLYQVRDIYDVLSNVRLPGTLN